MDISFILSIYCGEKARGRNVVRINKVIHCPPKTYFVIAALLVFSLMLGLAGLEYRDEALLSAIPGQPSVAPTGQISIVVKIPSRILELYSDRKLYKRYPVAVGRSESPTPTGDWTVIWKSYRAGDIFGTRYLGLDVPWGGYGIHGTNQPWSIGRFISQGCVRMRNRDIEELFEWVPVGTPVSIEDQLCRVERPLQYETRGADVVELQRKLKSLGYLEGRADGFFNKDTEVALKRFQHDRGLRPTGVTDKTTLKLLDL